MKNKKDVTGDSDLSADSHSRELLNSYRSTLQSVQSAMSDFVLPSFAVDSLEIKREDHGDRLLALKQAAEKLRTCAELALESESDVSLAAGVNDAMRELRQAIDNVYCVETLAWMELRARLNDALKDPRIEFNPEVVKFIASMLHLVSSAAGHVDYRSVLRPLEHQFKSEQASRIAAKKNLGPREWVKSEWAARGDKGQSKASFARQYSALVKARFSVDVTPEQISRVWLPKG